jgi:hypothetical protein
VESQRIASEHVSWYAGWPESLPRRGLHLSRVERVVFNWAYLLANEDYYERRIYTLCVVGFQNV